MLRLQTTLDLETLCRDVHLARRHGEPFALLVNDVDAFKAVNDEWGHRAGDSVLVHLAEILRQCLRDSDIAFRYAGDEFVVIVSHAGLDGGRRVAERLLARLRHSPFVHEGERLPVSVSIGLGCFNEHDTPDTLFDRVDRAMYAAKEAWRGQLSIAE